ncbi:MAG: hypothetical protein ACI8W8_002988 [Rhodothermales bacterium]|jgi:hypothetical protein
MTVYCASFSAFYLNSYNCSLVADRRSPQANLIVFSKRNTQLHTLFRGFYAPLIALVSHRKHVLTREEHEQTKWLWDVEVLDRPVGLGLP